MAFKLLKFETISIYYKLIAYFAWTIISSRYLSLFGALLLEPARQSDAAPQLRRAASRGAARRGRAAGALGRPSRGASRVFAALAALTGPKRWLCARAAPALAERSVAQGF